MANFFRSDGWVKTTLGPAVAGAQIYICLQPSNSAFLPPSPLALIYSDAGLTPITQPIISDGFGHYDFYALPGLYTVIVAYGGKVQQVYPDQSIGGAGTGGSSPILLETNNTPNFNQNVLNLIQGSGITIATDNLGNSTFTNIGTGAVSGPTTTNQILITTSSTTSVWESVTNVFNTVPRTAAISYTIDGGGSAITTGSKGQLDIPFPGCTITGWVLTADQIGSAVVDVQSSSYAGFPGSLVSICGGDEPTLSGTQKNENLAVSAWSPVIVPGTQLNFNVISATTVTRLNLTLICTVMG